MLETHLLEIEKSDHSRLSEIDFDNIPFGKTFSDHMLVAEYADGKWQSAKIKPYGPLSLSPATSILHYGQAIFEGMKAHRTVDGKIALFRPDKNFERFNKSAVRMAMPEVPEEIFMDGLIELIKLDRSWIPNQDGCALYIRPLMIATEPFIGVRTSSKYKFVMIIGPTGPYYGKPVSVMVTEKFARSVKGGVGDAKTAGNYGRTLFPVNLAHEKGYDDVLWLDGSHKKFIEEIGTMNVFFIIDGKLVTPEIDGTFLEGITRASVIQIANDLGYKVIEKKISIDDVVEAYDTGRLTEMFGTGTAATITHISCFAYHNKDYTFSAEKNIISSKLKTELEGIKLNSVQDRHHWLRYVD